jgi:hypothetical protein
MGSAKGRCQWWLRQLLVCHILRDRHWNVSISKSVKIFDSY